ncbi:hypothetical protein HY638_01460 [Candidatus Woesearchaeota archaeon]|nr:hypothetical protein [Candidatus Woesearchaeota archaeon]
MIESLENAIEEMKRVDHLVYVSLKYTRTVDVIKSAIDRMIAFFDNVIEGLLKQAKENKIIDKIPQMPVLRAELLKKIYPNDRSILNAVTLYLSLRKLSRARYDKREEYRRHVTMIAYLDDGNIQEIQIDDMMNYYETMKEFFEYVKNKP